MNDNDVVADGSMYVDDVRPRVVSVCLCFFFFRFHHTRMQLFFRMSWCENADRGGLTTHVRNKKVAADRESHFHEDEHFGRTVYAREIVPARTTSQTPPSFSAFVRPNHLRKGRQAPSRVIVVSVSKSIPYPTSYYSALIIPPTMAEAAPLPDGAFPRLNSSLLRQGSFVECLASFVGKFEDKKTFRCCDGGTIALTDDDAYDIDSIEPGMTVEIMGQALDQNTITVSQSFFVKESIPSPH